jgi:anti-anti-sigma regulatory factor
MSGSGRAVISVAISGPAGGISLCGRANVACSVVFKSVVEHLRSERIEQIYLYLGSCLLMDSTFLGVLAQQGVAISEEGSGTAGCIVLVTPSERVLDLIENLGVLESFRVDDMNTDIDFSFKEVAMDSESDLRELTRTSLEAHRTLINLNEENRARFEGVTSLLEKELEEPQKGDRNS